MIPQISPVSLRQRIRQKLNSLVLDGGFRPAVSGGELGSLLADITRLQKTDAAQASVLKAWVYAVAGDRDQTEYWLRNAASLGLRDEVTVYTFKLLILLGFPIDSFALFERAFQTRGDEPVHNFMDTAAAMAQFDRVVDMQRWAAEQKLVHKPTKVLAIAPEAARIMADAGYTQDMALAAMQQMFDVLREANVIWVGNMPDISLHEQGTPYAHVLFRFAVPFDATGTATLSWKLNERIVERNLDLPGLVITFMPAAYVETQREEDALTAS